MESKDIAQSFGHRVRLRVCGVLKNEAGILLLKHRGIGKEGFLWSPPGGGVQFGEPVAEALIREFREETGLEVKVEAFMFFHEYISTQLHALELFFRVVKVGGSLALGTDPELASHKQILEEIRFWPEVEMKTLPKSFFHARILEMTGN